MGPAPANRRADHDSAWPPWCLASSTPTSTAVAVAFRRRPARRPPPLLDFHPGTAPPRWSPPLVTAAAPTDLDPAAREPHRRGAAGRITGIHLRGLAAAAVRRARTVLLRDPDPGEVDAAPPRAPGTSGWSPSRRSGLAPWTRSSGSWRRGGGGGGVTPTRATSRPARRDAAGARVGTHLFNAMRPIHHREPGPVIALLEDPRVTVELIADGVQRRRCAVPLRQPQRRSRPVVVEPMRWLRPAEFGRGLPDRVPLAVDVVDGGATGGTQTIAGRPRRWTGSSWFAVAHGHPPQEEVPLAVRQSSVNPPGHAAAVAAGAGARADLVVLDSIWSSPASCARRGMNDQAPRVRGQGPNDCVIGSASWSTSHRTRGQVEGGDVHPFPAPVRCDGRPRAARRRGAVGSRRARPDGRATSTPPRGGASPSTAVVRSVAPVLARRDLQTSGGQPGIPRGWVRDGAKLILSASPVRRRRLCRRQTTVSPTPSRPANGGQGQADGARAPSRGWTSRVDVVEGADDHGPDDVIAPTSSAPSTSPPSPLHSAATPTVTTPTVTTPLPPPLPLRWAVQRGSGRGLFGRSELCCRGNNARSDGDLAVVRS